jgi:hypothetical protein
MIEIEMLQWVLSHVDRSKQEQCSYTKAKTISVIRMNMYMYILVL